MHIHRTGPTRQIVSAVAASAGLATNAIDAGTLVARSSDVAVPVTVFPWTTDLATTRANFAAAFLGVAISRNRAGKGEPEDLQCIALQDGEFECDVSSATYKIGDYLTPVKAAGNALTNVLEKHATAVKAQSVFVVVEDSIGNVTKVKAVPVNTPIKR